MLKWRDQYLFKLKRQKTCTCDSFVLAYYPKFIILQKEKQIAEEQSSCVNKAYFTLLKPLPRAQYLLERRGAPIEEDNSEADQAFLMEIMEVNEDIMDADTPDALQPIQMSNDLNIKNCVSEISKAFSNNNIDKAKEWTIRLKYFKNINDKIIGIYQKHFGAQ